MSKAYNVSANFLINFLASSPKSEKLHFDRLLLPEALRGFRWKIIEELCLMTLKSDAKFEEKLALGSKRGEL